MKKTFLTVLAILMGLAARAQDVTRDTPLDRLTKRYEQSGWEAVGRVDIMGNRFCTGALIAPDLVLTAAHCLVERRDNSAIDPARIVFKAGLSNGHAVAIRPALMTVVHPDFADRSSRFFNAVQTDIGLIRLASPIPTTTASPFAIGEQRVGSAVSVVSYARGRSEVPSWQRSCSVRGKGPGIAAFSCDVTFGSSGAPVFDTSRRRPMIVSVISRGNRDGKVSVSYGPLIRQPIAALKEALRTSTGVNVAGGGLASVVRQTEGARFVKPGSGARFVQP